MTPIDELLDGILPDADQLVANAVRVTRVELMLPLGLAYRQTDDGLGEVLAQPPSIAATTGFDPVFQKLRLVLEAET